MAATKKAKEGDTGGRKPTLPSLLAPKQHVNGNGNGKPSEDEIPQGQTAGGYGGATQLEDYNALERLLEAGTPEDLDTRTDLNELQILHFARAEAMAKYYGSNILTDYVASIKRKQISKGRKGRKEFVDSIRGVMGSDGGMMGMPANNPVQSMNDKLRS